MMDVIFRTSGEEESVRLYRNFIIDTFFSREFNVYELDDDMYDIVYTRYVFFQFIATARANHIDRTIGIVKKIAGDLEIIQYNILKYLLRRIQ